MTLEDVRVKGVNQWQDANEQKTNNEGYAGDNDYKLKRMEITSASGGQVDVMGIFVSMKIYEDLFSNTMSCTLTFQDTNNLARLLPIIGQREKLVVEFRIPSEETDSVIFEFDIFRVSVKNISTVGKKQLVKVSGVSSEQFKNVHTKISRSYYDTIDKMISGLFSTYLESDGEGNQHKLNIDVETDTEKRKFIIPNWHPFDAINWLMTRAQPKEKPTACNYLFYQDRDGFHLNTLDNLFLEKTPKQQYRYMPRKYRERPGNFRDPGFEMRNVQRLTITEPGNRLDENLKGMYGSKLLTHDIVRKEYEFTEYSLKDNFGDTNHVPQPDIEAYPIAQLLDNFSTEPDTVFNFCPIHKTLNQENELYGGDTVEKNEKYSQWLLRRNSMSRQTGSMIINVQVSGDSRRKCGDIVNLKTTPLQPGSKEDQQLDKYITGNYCVTSIKHNLTPEGYLMDMELSKDNMNDTYPDKSTFLKRIEENRKNREE